MSKIGLIMEQVQNDVVTDSISLSLPEYIFAKSLDRFDESFYRSISGLEGGDALSHFLSHGWRAGFDPCPLFSISDYLLDNPDVATSNMNPWVHYLTDGELEGRSVRKSRFDKGNADEDEARLFVDQAWYHTAYPDTKGTEPAAHYFTTGWKEGRNPNSYFDTTWYREHFGLEDDQCCPLVDYVRRSKTTDVPPNPIVDVEFLRKEGLLKDNKSILFLLMKMPDLDRVCSWFSRDYYILVNPDTVGSPLCPEMHFFLHGANEGRDFAPGCTVQYGRDNASGSRDRSRFSTCVAKFKRSGIFFRIIRDAMTTSIDRQIREQALIDPDVVAPGERCVSHLPQFIATDIATRDLINIKQLLNSVGGEHYAILIIPHLRIGGAEKYVANLAEMLLKRSRGSVLIVTTDSWPSDDSAALRYPLFANLKGIQIASLHEQLKASWRREQILALLMLRAKAKHIFVVNSELGLQMVRYYGKALATESNLYCAFFSEAPNGLGAPYSARFLRSVLPHARVIADNRSAIDHYAKRMGVVGRERMACLPQFIELRGERSYAATLAAREAKVQSTRRCKVLWVSRWEEFKAIDVLLETAIKMPAIKFHAFGPLDEALPKRLPRNLEHFGLIQDQFDFNLLDYDVFLFTSRFEGMPNTVLEMAVEGIPVVASDVGGLKEPFANEEIELVSMNGSLEEVTSAFVNALQRVMSLTPEGLSMTIRAARAAVMLRHSRHSFEIALAELLEETEDV